MNKNNNNVAIAEAYYTALAEKNVAAMAQYLHPDVRFTGPLATMTGKEALVETLKNLAAVVKSVTIRAKFGSEDQAMLAYDLQFPAPIGNYPAAALMTFCDGLITNIELFYDGRPMETKKSEVFSK